MTDVDALSALLEAATAFSEEASPGPWWRETGVATSEEEHIVWLTNEGRDTLMVNADDAAMLVNALPSLIEAARREAGLRDTLKRLYEAAKAVQPFPVGEDQPAYAGKTRLVRVQSDRLTALYDEAHGAQTILQENAEPLVLRGML